MLRPGVAEAFGGQSLARQPLRLSPSYKCILLYYDYATAWFVTLVRL
jgi:hypothetical protein